MTITDAIVSQLLQVASTARARAYAPYSCFEVGAALLSASGKTFSAANVENASFGLAICAERLAVAKAISEGEREFVAIAVEVERHASHVPCGACLQVLGEFCPPDFGIYVRAADGTMIQRTLAQLLPNPFRFEPSS